MLNRYTKNLLYGGNIWYFGEGMLGPLFAIFTERIGGSILEISWAWSTYLIMAGLMHIVIGKITDTYDNKEKVMVLGYALNAIFTFSYLLFPLLGTYLSSKLVWVLPSPPPRQVGTLSMPSTATRSIAAFNGVWPVAWRR